MRPGSIAQYERLYLLSLAIQIVTLVSIWPALIAQLANVPLQPGTIRLIVLCTVIATIGINLLLLWLTARRASNVARILVTLFFAMGIVAGLRNMLGGVTLGLPALIAVVQFVLEVMMVFLLFVPAGSKAWFARGRRL